MIAPQKTDKRDRASKRSFWPLIGAISIVAVIVAAVVAFLPSKSKEVNHEELEKPRDKIKEVTPAIVTNAVKEATPPRKRYKDLSREEKLQRIREKYGDNIPDNLKGEVYFLKNPPQETYHPAKSQSDIFKYRSERIIASLLRIEPGDFILQRRNYDEKFNHDFLASLQETIQIEDSDTEEQRALKTAVIDTKAEIVERMKDGSKPSDLLNEAADNLYDLGRYKRDLQEQLTRFKLDSSYTDQDIEDFVTAANQMLKSKGASEIPMPRFFMRRVSLKLAARRAAEKAIKEKKQ